MHTHQTPSLNNNFISFHGIEIPCSYNYPAVKDLSPSHSYHCSAAEGSALSRFVNGELPSTKITVFITVGHAGQSIFNPILLIFCCLSMKKLSHWGGTKRDNYSVTVLSSYAVIVLFLLRTAQGLAGFAITTAFRLSKNRLSCNWSLI